MVTLLRLILEAPKPVVARLNGHVRAGGLGLVGAADIVIASRAVTFAFTEVRIGVAPAIITLTTLGRMTERAAGRYLLTGEKFDAATAADIGLITAAVDDLDAAAAELYDQLRLCFAVRAGSRRDQGADHEGDAHCGQGRRGAPCRAVGAFVRHG